MLRAGGGGGEHRASGQLALGLLGAVIRNWLQCATNLVQTTVAAALDEARLVFSVSAMADSSIECCRVFSQPQPGRDGGQILQDSQSTSI